jgi:hypothetical protein
MPWLDDGFIRRVYRTSAVLAVLGAALLWELRGPASTTGLVIGAALSLGMLMGVEHSVRLLIDRQAGVKSLVSALFMKLAIAFVVLGLAFYGALQGWVSLAALIGGFALPHAVIVLKLLGQRLRAAMGQEAGPPPP